MRPEGRRAPAFLCGVVRVRAHACAHMHTHGPVGDVGATAPRRLASVAAPRGLSPARSAFAGARPLPSPIRRVHGSRHLPISSAKKKIPPASALISACHLMRPLLFIFLFVRRVGAVYVQPRQTQPPAGRGSPRLSPAGLPDWPCSGGPEVHAVDARKGYQETQTKTTCK